MQPKCENLFEGSFFEVLKERQKKKHIWAGPRKRHTHLGDLQLCPWVIAHLPSTPFHEGHRAPDFGLWFNGIDPHSRVCYMACRICDLGVVKTSLGSRGLHVPLRPVAHKVPRLDAQIEGFNSGEPALKSLSRIFLVGASKLVMKFPWSFRLPEAPEPDLGPSPILLKA